MEGARGLGPLDEVGRHVFRYYLRVRYIECDAQKVVFNSRYSEYVDVGFSEFLRAAGQIVAIPKSRVVLKPVRRDPRLIDAALRPPKPASLLGRFRHDRGWRLRR